MANLPSVATYITTNETRFKFAVSESLAQKLGSTMNYLLDHMMSPAGAIISWGGLEADVPDGWIIADGRPISRVTYSNLFAIYGTRFGIGDGASTFNVIDERGLFERMVDTTTQGTAGRALDEASRTANADGFKEDPGSYQESSNVAHTHTLPFAGGGSGGSIQQSGDSANYGTGILSGPGTPSVHSGESRPRNIYVFKLVKW